MALPSTGAISMSQVRTELNRTGVISLNDGTVRALAGKASGAISMADLRGKSAVEMRTVTTGTSGLVRGYSGIPGNLFGGISNASYGGRRIDGVYVRSSDPTVVWVQVSGTTASGWTQLWVNGTAHGLGFWTPNKDGMLGVSNVPNAYSIFASNFTVGFS